ncbi:MAG: gamma-glutamyltransferase family protein [Phycisphaerales bacterium]
MQSIRFSRFRTLALAPVFAALVGLGACASVPTLPSAAAPIAFERPGDAGRTYERGVVASDHPVASRAGLRMLELGGNAVDAAVATSFALSVVRPYSCGIGGGGFMVIHLATDPGSPGSGRPVTICIDYRERAPGAMGPDWFEDRPGADPRLSGHAVGIPGTVAGLLYALERYGTLAREQVLAPAIEAAREGFAADAHFASALNALLEEAGYTVTERGTVSLRGGVERGSHARRAGAMHLFWRFGPESNRDRYRPVEVGDRLTNLDQARVLEEISAKGADGFYRGPIARRIVESVQRSGGPLTMEDLASYRPVESEAMVGSFGTFTFIGMPLPSSGGITMLQTLGILEQYAEQMRGHVGTTPLDVADPADPVFVHALAECLKHAFANRARWLADPDFEVVPVRELLDADWFLRGADALHPRRVLPSEQYGMRSIDSASAALSVLEDGGTSHLSVVDQWGNAVACTETINLVFGSRILPAGLGFCLNNEIDDFTTRRGEPNVFGLMQAEANLPAPGKRPLSSMSPTIVLDADGRVVAVAGASGGPRIITGTLQVLLHALVFGDDAWTAVARPRFHHQWLPDVLRLEPGYGARLSVLTSPLAERGHSIEQIPEVGVVQLILRSSGGWQAASDPRKGGAPAGH